MIFVLFTQIYQKTQPFPESGGRVEAINSMDDWDAALKKDVAVCDFYATWCPPCRTVTASAEIKFLDDFIFYFLTVSVLEVVIIPRRDEKFFNFFTFFYLFFNFRVFGFSDFRIFFSFLFKIISAQAAPIYGKLSTTYDCAFYKCDVDKCRPVASREGIAAMPTFKIYKSGKAVETIQGFNQQALVNAITKLGVPQRPPQDDDTSVPAKDE